MSWLVNSLANSLKLDLHGDGDDDGDNTNTNTNTNINNNNDSDHHQADPATPPSDQSTPRRGGVKDDLSEFSKTFTRQLWGVASFLAPPPPPPPESESAAAEDPEPIAGIRNDLSEIGGKFKSEISKIASSILQFGVDEDLSVQDYADRGVVGVTNEVVTFARDVSMHPETWLDFPLPYDDDDDDDDDDEFELSDAQQEHALAMERLAPELAALRNELCLGYMTEGSFWKIYFVLVHPRLDRHDAVILSTPPIMKARAMLTQELQNRGKSRKPDSRTGTVESSQEEQLSAPGVDQSVSVEIISAKDPVIEKAVSTEEVSVIEKAVVPEVPVIEKAVVTKVAATEKSIPTTSNNAVSADEDDADEWLKEETEETSFKGESSYPVGNHGGGDDDEDVSFSDLEEDDDVAGTSKKPSGSNEVRPHTRENKEFNDWLDIEDIDDA